MLRTGPDAAPRDTPTDGPRAQRWSVVALQAVSDGPLVSEGEPDDGAFDPQRSYLLGRFRAFYAELNRVRRAALRGSAAVLALATEPVILQDPRDTALEASRRLRHVLEQLGLEAAVQTGEYGAERFREAEYAMAALADEIFINLEWTGREAWLSTLLESSLFGTQIAGEEIFRRIDALLGVRTGAAVDLATVYFMVLGLGFEGRYRGSDGSVLGGYRLRLYRFIYRHEAGRAGETLVPQAYAHTLTGSPAPRLPLVRRWALILGVTLAAFLAGSQLIWRSLTTELRSTSQHILDNAAKGGAP